MRIIVKFNFKIMSLLLILSPFFNLAASREKDSLSSSEFDPRNSSQEMIVENDESPSEEYQKILEEEKGRNRRDRPFCRPLRLKFKKNILNFFMPLSKPTRKEVRDLDRQLFQCYFDRNAIKRNIYRQSGEKEKHSQELYETR
jgi:hypothetical protein